ncbi:hypothetical protein ANN_03279 [Periplaneta americana]|uniref:Uncharacterized protein n=1 Tax=Periplaneta americana TaxID=6978 RepID=A0ABQ8U2M5_PERAM|nr:hypothetical protein ANN_03279 [Periplaneta americana]
MGLSLQHLMRYEQEVEAFLERIVTVECNMVQLRTAESITLPLHERGESVTCTRYSETLRTEMRRAVKNKRPRRLREGVILLHDIARPHTVRHTMDTIRDLR